MEKYPRNQNGEQIDNLQEDQIKAFDNFVRDTYTYEIAANQEEIEQDNDALRSDLTPPSVMTNTDDRVVTLYLVGGATVEEKVYSNGDMSTLTEPGGESVSMTRRSDDGFTRTILTQLDGLKEVTFRDQQGNLIQE
jgi:hypothetical protein